MYRPTLTKIGNFHGHRDCIYTLSPSIHSGKLLSAGSEGIIAEWDIASQEAIGFARTDSPIYSLLLLPENGLLLAGTNKGELLFLNMEDGSILKRVQAHSKGIFDLKLFPNGKTLLASGGEGALSVWNLDTLSLEHLTQVAPKSIRTLCFAPDGKSVYVGSSDQMIRRFNLNLKLTHEWTAHEFSIFRLLFSPDGQQLISGSRDAQINVWNVQEDHSRHLNVAAHLYAINDLLLHPELPLMFSGSMDKSIKIWDTTDWKLLRVIDHQRHQNHRNGINRLLWHEGHLFSCGDDRMVMQWKLEGLDR